MPARPDLRRTLKAALAVTGNVAAACAVAAVVAVAPTQTPSSPTARGAAVAPRAALEALGVDRSRTARTHGDRGDAQRAVAGSPRITAATVSRDTADRLSGVHDDLARAVAVGHVTPEQAKRFEAEMAGYITGTREVPAAEGIEKSA